MIMKYSNCVSLGWFCGVASSLSKLGLRSFSGPFDWYFSDFKGVINQIETDFESFLIQENIISAIDGKTFKDIKNGFEYPHEIKTSFENEYTEILSRYKHRIEIFKQRIKYPTVFYRCIRDVEEVEFINEKYQYIDDLLKQFNSKNEIIYVYAKHIIGLNNNVKSFPLYIDSYIGKTYEMRHMFDASKELAEYSASLLEQNAIKKNRSYDCEKNGFNAKKAALFKYIEEGEEGAEELITRSLNCKKQDSIYLWGAGNNGMHLMKFLKENGINVNGFVDNNIEKQRYMDNCISPNLVPINSKVFITSSNRNDYEEIKKQIKELDKNIVIAGYIDLDMGDY